MSRGCENIFDLIAHRLDEELIVVVVHLAMIQCESTRREHLVGLLNDILEGFGLSSKVVACLEDGGSNLKKCTKALKRMITFKRFQVEQCSNGLCFAHIIPRAASSALSQDIVNVISLIHINKDRIPLQTRTT